MIQKHGAKYGCHHGKITRSGFSFILAAVTSLLILLGFVHNNVIFEGRHTLGFCNAKGLGAISSLLSLIHI